MKVDFYRHQLSGTDANSIARVLDSPILTSGQVGREVEGQIKDYFGSPHSFLTNSWTNGALACLLALDIQPGDEVIVPAMTFIATSNIVELIGAKPVFADVCPETLLLTPKTVRKVISKNTRAIIPVHLYGQMVDIAAIRAVTGPDIHIIEDCAHCFEGALNGEQPGTHSEAAIFSFYATKNITCGEGGAIITRDDKLAEKIAITRLHGMSAGAVDRFRDQKYNHWDMSRLGVKANLPDLLAALLPSQIEAAAEKLKKREHIAQSYEDAFGSDESIRLQAPVAGMKHARHLVPICVDAGIRDELILALNAAGIGCTVNYRSIPTLTYYREKYGYGTDDFLTSYKWGQGTISLPMYPTLAKDAQNHVVDTLRRELDRLTLKAA
jgi:dTDP-4-amino-4,6-dideoxygalactose transaminase